MPKIKFSYPRGNFPRLCLIGNSNVGKSSITKLLLSHPQQYKGKVGKTAGSTVRLTIINDPALNYHVIDLPGFGRMVRLNKPSEAYVQKEILNYISIDKNNIFLMLLVVSADRLGEELEKWFFENEDSVPLTIEFIQYNLEHEIPCIVVLNKIDKLNTYQMKELREKFNRVLDSFNIEITGLESTEGLLGVLETSIKEQTGIRELKKAILTQSSRLDLSKFDPRSQLLEMAPINEPNKKPKKKKTTEKPLPNAPRNQISKRKSSKKKKKKF